MNLAGIERIQKIEDQDPFSREICEYSRPRYERGGDEGEKKEEKRVD